MKMDLVQKIQQLLEQIPEDMIKNIPIETRKMIIIKFGGGVLKKKLSPRVEKLIKVISSLSEEEKQELLENCPLHNNG